MAEIVLGIGTSHTPQMSSTVEMWSDHAERDRGNPHLLGADGEYHTYEELSAHLDPAIEKELDPKVWEAKYAHAQECIETLAARLAAARPDVVVIVGDDQGEMFDEDGLPAIGLFVGDSVWDCPPTPDRMKYLSRFPGLLAAQWAAHGHEATLHKVESNLAKHLAESLTLDEFDITTMANQPEGRSLGHAFTFARYRLHLPETTPIVPILLNTYYPPNVPSAGRCYALGQSLRKAIESWDSPARVALLGSGGLSHFVVLPEWDHMVLSAMANHDADTLRSIPRRYFRSGTSETLNWITVAGAFEQAEMELIDYVPGYRTPAATGTGMAFATWNP